MSAPDTNIERQKTRHIPMLRGVWIGLLIAAGVAFVALSGDSGSETASPAAVSDTSG
ncbi:hypothetical protein [uncultured Roseobacter sp.]|uniref:hypothetical protein n=1 Tax=uncultured Roseobacter sp. TaxID=114847 RepID=UPI0026208435|nr:hypothetical protein [uncultured Roseobacter sp.]